MTSYTHPPVLATSGGSGTVVMETTSERADVATLHVAGSLVTKTKTIPFPMLLSQLSFYSDFLSKHVIVAHTTISSEHIITI